MRFMKAQAAEILNFLILVVVVTIVIIVMKAVVIDQKISIQGTAQSSQEEGSFRSGVNAFMVLTEERSGKTFLELLGYVGFLENTTVDLGGPKNPLVINVTQEATERLNKLYGEGKWNLLINIPHRSGLELFVVADTSRSMCDDIMNLKTEIPAILNELKKSGKPTTVNLYFLGGSSQCYWKNNASDPEVHSAVVNCDAFKDIPDFRCHPISELTGAKDKCGYEVNPATEEDWGNGIACVSEAGPGGDGWEDFTVRIGIPLSDEMTKGSECCDPTAPNAADCPQGRISLDNGINSAIKNKVKVFPLRAFPCGIICSSPSESSCDDLTVFRGGQYCVCGNTLLVDWMNEMATKTGGAMFDLAKGSPAQAIKDIAFNVSLDRGPIFLGTPTPEEKRIRTSLIAAPMPNFDYLNVTLKQWT